MTGTINIIVPELGESVSEAIVSKWYKAAGDKVEADEIIVELETDKVSVEVAADSAGSLQEIKVDIGEAAAPGDLLGLIAASGTEAEPVAKPAAEPVAKPAAEPVVKPNSSRPLSPSVQRIVAETGIDPEAITGTGPGGRISKADALAASVAASSPPPTEPVASPAPVASPTPVASPMQVTSPMSAKSKAPAAATIVSALPSGGEASREKRVKMSRLRQVIGRRLKEAQNTAAMLTTFNDVDMSEIMALRRGHGEDFHRRHGVKLGFMGFFTLACVQALKEIEAINAQIDGDDIIYKLYYHIAIAVSTEKGLVTPVVRDADRLGLAGIESEIARLANLAREGKLGIEDLRGGSFTITNGGIYGSMLSTPILNPPQSGVLGMHRIERRAVVIGDKIEIRPMMYLALSYDHRLVDGKEAVSFLSVVKKCLENPERLLLDI